MQEIPNGEVQRKLTPRQNSTLYTMGDGLPFCSVDGFSVTKTGISLCVSHTVCTYIPLVFILVSGRIRLNAVASSAHVSFNDTSDSFLGALKRCCTVLLALVSVAACADVFRESNYKALKGHQSVALIVATFAKVIMWTFSYLIMNKEDKRGMGQTLRCIRGFWFTTFVCSTVSNLSAIPGLEALSSKTQLVLTCAYFGLTATLACIGVCYKKCSENDVSIYGDSINAGLIGGSNTSKFSSIQSSSRVTFLDSDQTGTEFLKSTFVKINGRGKGRPGDGDEDNDHIKFLDTSIDDGTLRKGRRSFDDFMEVEGLGDAARSPYTGGYHTSRDLTMPHAGKNSASAKKKKARSNTQDEMWKRFQKETVSDGETDE